MTEPYRGFKMEDINAILANPPEPEAPPPEDEGAPVVSITPHDREAEEATIGAVLINPDCYPSLAAILKPADFYIRRHGWIWQSFENLTGQGDPIDTLTMTSELERMGQLEEIGGPAYLTALLNQCPSSLNAKAYARKVKEQAARRAWIANSSEIATLACNQQISNDQIASRFAEMAQENTGSTQGRDPWDVFTLEDAYQDRPPVEYLAAGILTTGSLVIPYGAPGSLKSFLLADLAVCVAAGLDFLPPASWIHGNRAIAIKTKQCPVIWLDFDNGRNMTHRRFKALAKARNLPSDIPLFYYSMPSPWLDSSDPAAMGNLTGRVKELKAEFLVVDNLSLIKGQADINSADMALVMSQWRRMIDETGVTSAPVHHQRKTTGAAVRAGETLSGHNSIEASLDLALLIEREEFSDTVTVKSTKTRGEDVLPFSAIFTFEKDEHGDLAEAQFYGVSAEDTKSNSAIRREIQAVAATGEMNKKSLANAAKEALKDQAGNSPGINRIGSMIELMAMQGELKVTAGQRTEKIYRPSETYRNTRLTETYSKSET